jgi:endonuclease/exonuclease/phosphatase (EEP) superfamily protein YafD
MRRIVTAHAWLVVLLLLPVAGARLVGADTNLVLLALDAITEWLYLPAWAVLAWALAMRDRRLALAAVPLVVLHLAWILPHAFFAAPLPPEAATAPHLRVMTANLLMVNTDTEGIVGEILAARPNVLLVQELAPQWEDALDAPSVKALLPERIIVTREDSFGIGIYADRPLEDADIVDLAGLPQAHADVLVDGPDGPRRVHLLNFHTLPPRTPAYTAVWNQMMAAIVDQLAQGTGPTVVAGDLNATRHHAWFRALVSGRLREAHEDRGRALATTWPNGLFPVPPIRLDHVLISKEIACLSITEGVGRGSDHRPLVADLAILGG